MTVSSTTPLSKRSIYLLLASLIMVWGSSWPIAKIGLQYIPPLWFTLYRLIIATGTMFIIVILLKRFVWPTRKDLKIILAIGIFQIALFMAFLNLGLNEVSAGRSAVLVYTTPIWVMPISTFFFGERSTLLKWLGFILGIVGILILFNPHAMNWSSPHTILGNVYLLLAALCWSIAILCARYMTWTRPPIELISWQLLLGTVLIAFFVLYEQPHVSIVWNSVSVFSLLYSAFFATAFAYWGSVVISKELPATTSSLSLLAIPVCAFFFSTLLLGESISLSIALAMLFILGGLLCVIVMPKIKY